MSAPGLNLLVFRDGRKQVSGHGLKNALAQQLRFPETSACPSKILAALLQAGELECALADQGAATAKFETITDEIALVLAGGAGICNSNPLLAALDSICVPPELTVSLPEGFAFYALHPLAFADVLKEFPFLPSRVSVIGIRSIGTTLSAVTAAALRLRGIQAERMTVRPQGHPYNRRTEFSAEELHFVRSGMGDHGIFLIVDEGPGLSGSSFLSVAEALVQAGAPRDKIILISSHAADPDRLCAENAATRWRQFRSVVVPSHSRPPAGAQVWIGGGEWRRYLLRGNNDDDWPAVWLSFERLKYLSGPRTRKRTTQWKSTESRFYKFAGFGHYGEGVFQREERVAVAGFGPMPQREGDGYVSYPFLDGRPMHAGDLSPSVLARLAAYCAFRQRSFAASFVDVDSMRQMVEHNLQQWKLDGGVNLQLERGVIPDGRMQPHEWLLTPEGQMLKTDSGSHGDDHFFPGSADIAWDLAGAIVEWRMSAVQAESFLDMYRRASGDQAQSRIADYITAYTAFRHAYCLMAANAMHGTEEQGRLEQAAFDYRLSFLGRYVFSCSPARL